MNINTTYYKPKNRWMVLDLNLCLAAKPNNALFIEGLILSFMKKTQAAPKTVPITGIPNPAIIPFILEL